MRPCLKVRSLAAAPWSSSMSRPVKVRIAPSPTGDPHVGTGYIGLFNYAFAKQNEGSFILRIEDTDQSRCSKESEDAIFESLRWMGIEWQEGPDVGGPNGPYRQSERLSIYREHAQILLDGGHAYQCTCTSERLTELREKQKAEKAAFFGYDGHCRDRQDEVAKEIKDGAEHVLRLKTPNEGETIVQDFLRGEVAFKNEVFDDQVLMKTDGFPTYHLANVVDDHLMGVTHVIRGEEWIPSTPKHVILYQSFGWKMPVFCHVPLLRNDDKSKVSKRKNPVSISHFKQAGYLPDAFLNFLGTMAFTFRDERDVFSLKEFVEEFDLKRISLGGPVFDLVRLKALNGRYLREKRSDDEWVTYLKKTLFSDDYLKSLVPLIKERVDISSDLMSYAPYFFMGEIADFDAANMFFKERKKKDCTKIWDALAEEVDRLREFNAENVDAMLKSFCEKHGLKGKEFFMPLRLMLTGTKATPAIEEVLEVLGRERVRYRIRAAITAFKKVKNPN
ncbi:MAG: glutamate--tRNA ligase [Deltaproteobacteria bacterium]|nr:glutamate--tRNA ligase [Deltaproteobacteria bacterium]